jgi:MFS transporter, putative metabolite:H+ symporter
VRAYQSELHPTRIRVRGRLYLFVEPVSTIFVGLFVAFFLRNYGTVDVFQFIASAMVAVFT